MIHAAISAFYRSVPLQTFAQSYFHPTFCQETENVHMLDVICAEMLISILCFHLQANDC